MIKDKKQPEYAIALKSLMKGAVYREDEAAWNQVVSFSSSIRGFFEKLGLDILIDEQEGFAFLKSLPSDDGKDTSGGLVVRRALSRNATVLCVVLREELHLWERSEREDQACVVTRKQIREKMLAYTKLADDDSKFHNMVDNAISQAAESHLIRQINSDKGSDKRDEQTFQIQRIIKARLSVDELQNIKNKLADPDGEASEDSGGGEDAIQHA